MRRKFFLIFTGIALSLFGGLIGASSASAHNTFSDSSPRDGEILTSAPATWSVTFQKSVPLESASGSVINGDGTRTVLASLRHGANNNIVVFDLPPGLSGVVSARWRLVSSDGHVISGRVAFTVQNGTGSAPSPPAPAEISPVDESTGVPDSMRVALRFANFSSIILIGGLFFVEFDIAAGALATRRGRKLMMWALGTLVAVPTAQFLIFANDINNGQASFLSAAGDALTMTPGGMLLLRVVAGAALGWFALGILRTGAMTRQMIAPSCVVASIYLIALAYVGHSRSQVAPWLGVPVDVVHTAGVAVWLGGLAALLLVVVPVVESAAALNAFSRFSFIAERAVAVIAVTGVIQTVRLHGNPIDMLSNTHGLLLIAKIALVVVMLRLAIRNRRTLQHHRSAALANNDRSRDLLLRATTTEVLFGFGVLVLTAILVAVTPG